MSVQRGLACWLWTSAMLAQVPGPELAPIDNLTRQYWTAQQAGRSDQAAAAREQARKLLEQIPPAAPRFSGWVQQVSQLYTGASRTAQARSVLEQGLARAGTPSARIGLLEALGQSWMNDRHLLQAIVCLERAAALAEAAAAEPPLAQAAVRVLASPTSSRLMALDGRYSQRGPDSIYQQLANLYRQVGRREDAVKMLAKINARPGSEWFVASFYEQDGRLDEAAAAYRKQAEQPGSSPQQVSSALEALARLYQRQQRMPDAIAAMQQAAAALESAGQSSVWVRSRLAGILQQAGDTSAADRLYTQLLEEEQNKPAPQVLFSYATHLAQTGRGEQAGTVLKDYLNSHPNLPPSEEVSILYNLANVARMSGRNAQAEEYRKAAEARQSESRPGRSVENPVNRNLQEAQAAANQGDLDRAFVLAMQALDRAPGASDGTSPAWQIPNLAQTLASRKAPEKAEQLYRRLFTVAESFSADTLAPLLQAQQQWVQFLMNERRWSELPEALDRYRTTVREAHGPVSGAYADIFGLEVDAARRQDATARAVSAAQDRLALEESLAGTASAPYFFAAEALAGLLEGSGDRSGAVDLRLRNVTIADRVFAADGPQRGSARMSAALTLARERRFEEADRLAGEALALAAQMNPPRPDMFRGQLAQLEQLKSSGANQPRNPDGSSRWFDRRTTAAPAQIKPL